MTLNKPMLALPAPPPMRKLTPEQSRRIAAYAHDYGVIAAILNDSLWFGAGVEGSSPAPVEPVA